MKQVTQYWLSQLCSSIQDATHGVVCLHSSDTDNFHAVAFWPEGLDDHPDFSGPVKAVLNETKWILLQERESGEKAGEPVDIIAYPLFVRKRLDGVVVIRMSGRVAARQQAAIQQVEGAAFWFESLIHQHAQVGKSQLVALVELVASCLEHDRFQSAATEIMTDLATRLSCTRVSIGLLHGQTVELEAVSHSAGFDRKASLIRDIGEAMHEAMDQNDTIVHPEPDEAIALTLCHAALAKEHGLGAILTVPFASGGGNAGAIMFERASAQPFDVEDVEYMEQIVSMIGPLLELRHRNEQWLPQRIYNSIRGLVVKVIGPGYPAQKTVFAVMVLGLAVMSFVHGDYRITGAARLEASTQRLVVTPQDGYIASADVRPGDIVHNGDPLGSLDDKDLQLEGRRWSNQLGQLQTEYRDALARHDRSRVSIVKAEMLQAEAQLNLVGEKLSRIRFTAPFDGLVVSGDLSQMLGSPVERGQVLFKVAPLEAYRVILQVDERDIDVVRTGQSGQLVLAGMPRKPMPFTVEKITPVSTAEKGRNFFQVEAQLKEKTDLLRPGMEGFAKIAIDRRRLIWIWSHRIVDWMRLTFWYVGP
jgi:multidrug efflux pump subunit AcrA (membrane-fusion protein)